MNKDEFVNYLQKNLKLVVNNQQLDLLDKYYNLLINWNKKINLTAIVDKNKVYLKHFYDSLTLCHDIDMCNINYVVDVGSGAGFPGIVLKIFFPHIKLDIIDSNNKKILFLNDLIQKLEIKNVNLIHDRAEQYAKTNLEKYDLCVSRAVANLNILVELCLPLVKIGGYFLALKGNAHAELEQIPKAINILGGEIVKINNFLLPIENSQRTNIKIKKIKHTPAGFPRRYDQMKKKPLK